MLCYIHIIRVKIIRYNVSPLLLFSFSWTGPLMAVSSSYPFVYLTLGNQHVTPPNTVNQELRLNQFTLLCNIFHYLINPPKHMWNYGLLFTILLWLKCPSCGRNSWCDWLYPTNCMSCALVRWIPHCPAPVGEPVPAPLPFPTDSVWDSQQQQTHLDKTEGGQPAPHTASWHHWLDYK